MTALTVDGARLTGQWPHVRNDCQECGERDADLRLTWRGVEDHQLRCMQCAARSLADLAPIVGPVLVTTPDMPAPVLRSPGAAGPAPAARGLSAAPPPAATATAPAPVERAAAPAPAVRTVTPADLTTGDPHQLLTTAEVAQALRVNVETVRRWAEGGTIGSMRAGRQIRIPRSALTRFLLDCKTGSPAQ